MFNIGQNIVTNLFIFIFYIHIAHSERSDVTVMNGENDLITPKLFYDYPTLREKMPNLKIHKWPVEDKGKGTYRGNRIYINRNDIKTEK
jgi:hypothetical protein